MRFDWQRFCASHRVRFVTSGPNTGVGNISIKCPFCGAGDPSEHMGLSLNHNEPYWGCLRNHRHRGRHPATLIAQLLGISYVSAKDIVDGESPLQDDFAAAMSQFKDGPKETITKHIPLELMVPKDFRQFTIPGSIYMDRSVRYMADKRGFAGDAFIVCSVYRLWWAMTGDQAYRLIFPVWDPESGGLIGWTGRDITGQSDKRYKAREGMGKDFILAFDSIHREIDHLFLCEGPMDALKIDYYGRKAGHKLAAVAMMGTAVTHAQVIQIIHMQRHKGLGLHVLFDNDATAQNLSLAGTLQGIAGDVRHIALRKFHDPGDMKGADIKAFLAHLKKA